MFTAITEDIIKYQPDYIVFPDSYNGSSYYDYFITNSQKFRNILQHNYQLERDSNNTKVFKKNVKEIE